MMLRGTVFHEGKPVFQDIALNEIVATSAEHLRVLRYDLAVNDEYLNEYAADGVMVATPTGSTAYNLSAGGPVMAPAGRMMAVTPVCSHTLNARSIVLSEQDRVKIGILGKGLVTFDGDTSQKTGAGDYLIVERSHTETVMVKLKQISYAESEQLSGKCLKTGKIPGVHGNRWEEMQMKLERHSKIVELIGKYEIETQEELAEKLTQAGFNVTQATVSRDIRELKLTKIPGENGRQRYMVLESPRGTSASKYIRILKDGFVSMDMAQNILVIKTVSGMAMAVAAALDAIKFHEVVGCIAGDDTIMCAVRSVDDTIIVMEKIKKMVED